MASRHDSGFRTDRNTIRKHTEHRPAGDLVLTMNNGVEVFRHRGKEGDML